MPEHLIKLIEEFSEKLTEDLDDLVRGLPDEGVFDVAMYLREEASRIEEETEE